MNKKIESLLRDIREGSIAQAGEAAKKFNHMPLHSETIARLEEIALKSRLIHQREAATYALARNSGKPTLKALLNLLNAPRASARVRGQAMEGVGCHGIKTRAALGAIESGLNDTSPTVRFWSCYAAGHMGLKSLLPKLEKLKKRDHAICPGWWRVSEEAEDAIEWIHGRDGKERNSRGSRA